MLTLHQFIKLDDEAVKSPNLCSRFQADDLARIGEYVWEGYDADNRSRTKWVRRTQAAMDLAMQVQKEKSFPWAGCANVAFPLVTIASLQFHSRAYPQLIQGTDIVKCQVIGEDPSGEKTSRAKRVSMHMSWQKMTQQKEWEEQKDRLLINLPIVGTVFTKSYYDPQLGREIDETVLAQDLVVDYWAKSVDSCPRKTHVIPMFRNQIYTGVMRKIYRDVRNEPWYQVAPQVQSVDAAQAAKDNRQGTTPPPSDETTPFRTLEQHVDIDMDGDGYAEPYIITIEESSKAVLRIVTGFDRPEDIERTRDGKIISINRMEYFTRYEFIPSPDGGIYGEGFGVLLGPLNESTNTIINQLLDAGTMQTTKGGFLARGVKIRGGAYTFGPFEWKRVDSQGDDLRKGIVPLEVGEPSQVLMSLLSLLINYVERLSGTTDPMVGESPGQNTPAEVMRTMVQEGQRVYSAVFKRVWRSMKEEFRKGFILNGIFMPIRKSFGQGQFVYREDYLGNPDEVTPVADPNIASDQMALSQAMMLKQNAATTPGYNMEEVERRVLKALKIDNIDQVFPGVEKTGAPKDVKLQIAELKANVEMAWLEKEKMEFVVQMQEDVRMGSAQIAEIAARIEDMKSTTQGDDADRQVAIMQSVMKLLGERNNEMLSRLDVMKKQLEIKRESIKANAERGNIRRLETAPRNGSAGAGFGEAAAAA